MGTDPLDACPDDPNDDAWPPDFKNDGNVNILDVVTFRLCFRSCTGDPSYDRRHDLDTSGCVNILDVVKLRPLFRTWCTNP